MSTKNKRKKEEKRITVKLLLCIICLIVITILFVCSYQIFKQKQQVIPWDQAKSVEDYAYIEVSKMSEKFAYFEESKKQVHFVIEEEASGAWHTYIIAIEEDDYEDYKSIIDYTYERVEKKPRPKKVYGYPVIISDKLKEVAIENIPNFVPAENEIEITTENFNQYLTNSYLDTTIEREEEFSVVLLVLLFLLFIMIIIFIITAFSKDKVIDDIDDLVKDIILKIKR